ncbi:hypothetical protein OUZ56_001799 [Daphnia magna]|uniref:Uncharacterized protein n=1 Tax=Daphnia magna TaxID=35525 RepID=A0ABR0A3S0_9CRUS|nr:hypothetical protein OUZ56_001799 [Daphnia magna]
MPLRVNLNRVCDTAVFEELNWLFDDLIVQQFLVILRCVISLTCKDDPIDRISHLGALRPWNSERYIVYKLFPLQNGQQRK